MVFLKPETLVHSIKLSSVGPGSVTGQDVVHEPSNMDLAMKLHYLRAVYYFNSQAGEDYLTTLSVKESMFVWLNWFYITCGRFRRADSGRPYIKCNDCGARFVEAQCVKTIDEWVEMLEDLDEHKLLVPDQVIGPELAFSPLIFLQLTRFKCGGVSLGLSWAHVLGDAFSAADFMNSLGQIMAGHQLDRPLKHAQPHSKSKLSPGPLECPLSMKRVGPVGNHWISPQNCKMEKISFNLSTTQIRKLKSKVSGPHYDDKIPTFECICALIWKVVAKIRNGSGPNAVTICKNDPVSRKKGILNNNQAISIVEADFSIMEASPKELSESLINRAIDDLAKIEEAVEREQGLSDFVIYGANLTFVDLDDADFYGFELKGEKPVYASCAIDGIGEEGVVLVLPGPQKNSKDGNEGKVVMLIMPGDEVFELKSELKREFSIA